jgi:phytoene dehydrogenase-like protein
LRRSEYSPIVTDFRLRSVQRPKRLQKFCHKEQGLPTLLKSTLLKSTLLKSTLLKSTLLAAGNIAAGSIAADAVIQYGEYPLNMGAVKLHLEEVLPEAGVRILYASLVTEILAPEGGL